MKKNILVWALAVAASFGMAQSFQEGFNWGPAGWNTTIDYGNVAGGQTLSFSTGYWHARNLSVPTGSTGWFSSIEVIPTLQGAGHLSANFNSTTGANNINSFFMSPVRTFKNGDIIRFSTRTVSGTNYPDRLYLVWSGAGASVDPANFTTTLVAVNPTLVNGVYPQTYTQFSATISGLSGPTSGRFAFNYNVTNGGSAGLNSDNVAIDNVQYVADGVEPGPPSDLTPPQLSQSIIVPGPTNTIDQVGDPDNVIVNYTTTGAMIPLLPEIFFYGTFTRVLSGSWGRDACVRIRDAAYPGLFADVQGFTSMGLPTEFQFYASRTLTGGLAGTNIAAGASWTLEFYEAVDNAPNTIEGRITDLKLDLFTYGQTLSGTLNLSDTVFGGAYTRTITGAVKQGATTVGAITVSGINASSVAFSGSIPASATGAATIEWDGSSFLLRKINVTLTGANLAVGTVNLQNGDVDNSGEVDAADIDEVIADFGDTSNNPSDVDVSGEVDAADIDIVIANFGGTND